MLNTVIHFIAHEGPYVFFLFCVAEGLLLLKENKPPQYEYIAAFLVFVLVTIWAYYLPGISVGRAYYPLSLLLISIVGVASPLIILLLINQMLVAVKRLVVKHVVLMALSVPLLVLGGLIHGLLFCVFIKCSDVY